MEVTCSGQCNGATGHFQFDSSSGVPNLSPYILIDSPLGLRTLDLTIQSFTLQLMPFPLNHLTDAECV